MIRSWFLSKLSPPTTPAQRLALAFGVSEHDAKVALDRLDGDEHRATLLLLYAAKWHRTVHGALDIFGPDVAVGLTRWEGTIEGQYALTAWRLNEPFGPFRLRFAVGMMRELSDKMARDFERHFPAVRAALRRETGR